MIKAVLFDMDGTVFDTEKIYFAAWVRSAKEIGRPPHMEQVMSDIFGMSEENIGRYFRERFGADFPFERMLSLRAGFIRDSIEHNGVPLKPGVPEVFDQLHLMGVRVALVSSAPRFRIDDFLMRARLQGMFDCVISGERVQNSKPHPDIFLLAAKEIGCRAEECVAVEDSHNGVWAGKRAGMRVVMVPDLQQPTAEITPLLWHCIKTLQPLPTLVAHENLN